MELRCCYPLFLLLTATPACLAQLDGDLDTTFSSDGIATTNFAPISTEIAFALAIQADGKVVAAGASYSDFSNKLALARYTTAGLLDETFGAGGTVTTAVGTIDDRILDVVMQPDGKIIAVGRTEVSANNVDWVVARYLPDGSLDESFSDDGMALFQPSTFLDEATGVALQPDGKIVVTGSAYSDGGGGSGSNIVVGRYLPSGMLDLTFGNGGSISTDIFFTEEKGYGMTLDGAGNILVCGVTDDFSDPEALIVRYTPDGALDPNFGNGGMVTVNLADGNESFRDIAIQPDGKILAAGYALNNWTEGTVVRYLDNGSLDPSFSGDGIVTLPVGYDILPARLVVLPDERILLAGTCRPDYIQGNILVALLHSDGSMDDSFSGDGMQNTLIGDGATGQGLVVQDDAHIVVAGHADFDSTTLMDFAIVRYLLSLDLGLLSFDGLSAQPLIYPNPLDRTTTLSFVLEKPEQVRIDLLDMKGRNLLTLLPSTHRQPGKHVELLNIPESLASGSYVIAIRNASMAYVAIQVVK